MENYMEKEILLVAINAKYIHSNLAVYNLKAASGENSQVIDIAEYTINNRIDEILDDIYRRKPKMIGFSCYIWNIEYVEKLLVEINKLLPSCEIWLGGPEASYNTEYFLDTYSFITGIMVGEGEGAFSDVVKEFLSHKEKGQHYDSIPGVCTHGKRKETPRECVDMSHIPFAYEDMSGFENRIIYYESSRGCPFSCSYCLSSIDKKMRYRDISIVLRELYYFLEKKVRQVKFVDRTFNADKERSAKIWKYISDHDNGITNFHFEISADLLTEDQIKILENMRPGLVQLEIGVQSTNPQTIKAIRRKMDIDKLKRVVSRLNAAGNIHLHLDLIAGLPYEDMESFKNSFNQVYGMKPHELQLGFLKVLHGSPMYEDAKEYQIKYKNYPPYEVLTTQWLSYDEVLTLKKVEEVLEIYFGSGQFKCSVGYLVEFFQSPYDFYESLGEFYFAEGRMGEKHSRIERYNILLRFAEGIRETVTENRPDLELLKELMTFDIYLRENIKTRPAFSRDISEYKEVIKAVSLNHERGKTDHMEIFSEKAVSEIKNLLEPTSLSEEIKSDGKDVLIRFSYDERNPVDYNAAIKVAAVC